MFFQQREPLFFHLEYDIDLLLKVLSVFFLNRLVVVYPFFVHIHLFLEMRHLLTHLSYLLSDIVLARTGLDE
jgi:hypothetical protein